MPDVPPVIPAPMLLSNFSMPPFVFKTASPFAVINPVFSMEVIIPKLVMAVASPLILPVPLFDTVEKFPPESL